MVSSEPGRGIFPPVPALVLQKQEPGESLPQPFLVGQVGAGCLR